MTTEQGRGGDVPLDRSDSALLETLLHEAPLGFAFYGTDLRYRRINRALAVTNGLPVEEHLGRRPSELLPPELGNAVEDMLRQVLTTGETLTDDDFTARGADGRTTHWQSAWYPARGPDGQIIGVAVLVSDVTERRLSEARLRLSHRRTERLQRATAKLAKAMTLDEVAEVIADIGSDPGGAVWAGLALVEGDQIRYAGRGTSRPSGLHLVPLNERTPTTQALRTGNPVYLKSRSELFARFPTERSAAYVARSAEHAWVIIPLNGVTGPRAALRLAYGEERTLGPDDEIFLEALAGQCALALERARLYDRERRTAVALQKSLLPARLPQLDGLEIAARFFPAEAEDAEVGGDWYDAYRLPTGEVALVIGDVMGKGVVAAAGMGRVRSALRALSMSDAAPEVVLDGLDLTFSATEGDEQLVTLVYAVLDPVTRWVRAGGAGHPPLLHLPGDGGPPRYLTGTVGGTPLGLPEHRGSIQFRLGEGDLLIGYTDGLIESRERDLDAALEIVAAVAAGVRDRPVADVVDVLAEAMTGGRPREDDVTVLAVRTLRTG